MCYNCFYYGGDRQQNHFCNLMQKPLKIDELRVECPEHTIKEKSSQQ
jgi:hypothetical protein